MPGRHNLQQGIPQFYVPDLSRPLTRRPLNAVSPCPRTSGTGRQAGCMERGVTRQQSGRMHAERSCKTAGSQDACRMVLQDSRQPRCMQRRVARQKACRMHAEGSGQTEGRQDACREWPDRRQAGCMQRGVVRRQAGRMHAEESGDKQL